MSEDEVHYGIAYESTLKLATVPRSPRLRVTHVAHGQQALEVCERHSRGSPCHLVVEEYHGVPSQRPTTMLYPGLTAAKVWDPSEFPLVRELEANYAEILQVDAKRGLGLPPTLTIPYSPLPTNRTSCLHALVLP